MNPIVKKSSDNARGLLFGLLINCMFSGSADENCPLQNLRSNLTIEEKHKLVMELSDEEIKSILVHHEVCYENKLSNLMKD